MENPGKLVDNQGKHNYIYIVQCRDGSLYTGWTNDLKKRIQAHNAGKGARYTKGRGPVTLVYWEAFSTKKEAMRREYEIKRMARTDKIQLIRSFGAVPELKAGLKNESVHDDKVAGASGYDKQMENLVASEVLVSAVENGKLQSIDHTADGVDDTSCQKPSESCR